MISGRDIVLISSVEWDFLWQGPQEISTRLARAGNRILYIENTGIRQPGLRDAARVARRVGRWASALKSSGVREVAHHVYVCSPLVMPPFGASWRGWLNRRLLLPLMLRAVRHLKMRDPLLWTYLPTDTAIELMRQLRTPHSFTVYHCVDNFAQLTPYVRQLGQSEKEVVQSSDLVFATCQKLASNCAQFGGETHLFPFGVNLDAFPLNGSAPVHIEDASSGSQDSLRSLARPVIGYVGGLHRHVDFGLVAEMARARPRWSWVFVGPLQTDVGELASLPNVRLVGQRTHNELVGFIRGFDVCIVPYVRSLYTETVVPTKINEYLAVGKPIVSTDLPSVLDFNERHDILITTPAEPTSFLKAIEAALRLRTDEETSARRREVARLGEWQSRLEAISDLIEHKWSARIQNSTD